MILPFAFFPIKLVDFLVYPKVFMRSHNQTQCSSNSHHVSLIETLEFWRYGFLHEIRVPVSFGATLLVTLSLCRLTVYACSLLTCH